MGHISDTICDVQLLDRLLDATGPVGIDQLAQRRGMSQERVVAELQRLTDAGCVIEQRPGTGVSLAATGLAVWRDYLLGVCPLADRRVVEVYQQTTSTQDAVRRVIGAFGVQGDGALAVADEQTAGRGRVGRRWRCPPGAGLTFSRAVVPGAGETSEQFLTLVSAVALAEAIEHVVATAAPQVDIKWPNDLLIDGRKVAGILVERFTVPFGSQGAVTAAVIGVGVNTLRPATAPIVDDAPELPDAAYLSDHGFTSDRLRLLAQAVRSMDAALAIPDAAEIIRRWRRRCLLPSQPVQLQNNGQTFTGRIIDIDLEQGLIVRTNAGGMVHLPTATTSPVPSSG